MPFIEDGYEKSKLLIVGESHYLGQTRKNRIYDLDYFRYNWWNGNCDKLNNDYEGYYNTRNVVSNYLNGERHRGHIIFTNIVKSYSRVILNEKVKNISYKDSQKFNDLAFMNFFQMPSLFYGEKFWDSLSYSAKSSNDMQLAYDIWDKAVQVSSEVLDDVIDILKPKLVFFTSISAFKAYSSSNSKYSNNKIVVKVPHPGCPWWNKPSSKSGGKSGKEIFEEYLLNYAIAMRS